ncbi:carbohydrate porin [Temperatibacter marinus]|uniref:Carbohydrate porin n=1 Tax=Temperatibacter marinus TaxID=1456591 RepID=A0AA52HA50_9PROT|nr:carbohydrate porin [Temperatibacter marinus]WND03609.1 carbohydrate porin [Temperatibacter marinus]
MTYKNAFTTLVCIAAMSYSTALVANDLEEVGIDLGGSYEVGLQAAPLGSDAGGSSKQRFTLNLKADMNKLLGLENGTLFFQYQNHNGEHGVNNIFDIQQFDGLDDPEYDRIHMFWYQHVFLDGAVRVKIGKVEPKSEFFAPENARNHLGFSTERSPTIIAQGPPSMSINTFLKLSDSFTFAMGVYDASWNSGRDENTFKLHNFFDANEFAIFLEGRYTWEQGINGLPGGVKLGGWRLEGDRDRFSGRTVDGTDGYYVVYDQTLTENGIGVYAQYGHADKRVSALSRHVGLGMQWKGPFQSRENDVFGAGLSTVKFSDVSASPFSKGSETAYELFYKAPITDWFTLQFDVQAINNPGGQGAEDVVVSVLRGTFSF